MKDFNDKNSESFHFKIDKLNQIYYFQSSYTTAVETMETGGGGGGGGDS